MTIKISNKILLTTALIIGASQAYAQGTPPTVPNTGSTAPGASTPGPNGAGGPASTPPDGETIHQGRAPSTPAVPDKRRTTGNTPGNPTTGNGPTPNSAATPNGGTTPNSSSPSSAATGPGAPRPSNSSPGTSQNPPGNPTTGNGPTTNSAPTPNGGTTPNSGSPSSGSNGSSGGSTR